MILSDVMARMGLAPRRAPINATPQMQTQLLAQQPGAPRIPSAMGQPQGGLDLLGSALVNNDGDIFRAISQGLSAIQARQKEYKANQRREALETAANSRAERALGIQEAAGSRAQTAADQQTADRTQEATRETQLRESLLGVPSTDFGERQGGLLGDQTQRALARYDPSGYAKTARDAAFKQPKTPPGYRPAGSGLEAIPGGPGDPSIIKRNADARRDPMVVTDIFNADGSVSRVAVPRASLGKGGGTQVLGTKPKVYPEGQAKAAGYANRMVRAGSAMNDLTAKGFEPGTGVAAAAGGVSNYLLAGDEQQYRQAQEDWVRAKLRRESGAVISDDEMSSEITTYFPRPGDKEPVIQQKKKAREAATQNLIAESQGAYGALFPKSQPTPTPAPRTAPAANQAGAVSQSAPMSGMNLGELSGMDLGRMSPRQLDDFAKRLDALGY